MMSIVTRQSSFAHPDRCTLPVRKVVIRMLQIPFLIPKFLLRDTE